MKIENQNGTSVESQGVTGQGAFSLKASAHAFQLLSSGLYTNKIAAVIRELSCNAADAHVLNQQQAKAFDLKLPNALDQQFYVRDYGPGLSEKDVMSLYTTYFDSTKQQSNDFTGGFGVGSKSPFAYTDSFTVTSIHDGLKTIYTAYTDEDSQTPLIVEMGDSVPTDEPSGLQVGFPVRSEDYTQFHNEAAQLMQWFNVPVNVLGVSTKIVPVSTLPIKIKTSNITVYNNKIPGLSSPISLSMGNVCYPVLPKNIKEITEKDNAFKDAIKYYGNIGAVIQAPIGSVSVAASREALAHDKKTNAWLTQTLKDNFKELIQKVWTEKIEPLIKPASTLEDYFEANKILEKFNLQTSNLEHHVSLTPDQKEWLKERVLYDPKNPPKTFTISEVSPYSLMNYSHSLHNDKILSLSPSMAHHTLSQHSTVFVENGSRAHSGMNGVDASFKSLFNPKDRPGKIYVITPKSNVKKDAYEAEFSAWKKTLGVSTLAFTSFGTTHSVQGVIIKDIGYNPNPREFNEKTNYKVLWLTESEYKRHKDSFSSIYYALRDIQKNLKFKEVIDNFVIIDDNDAAKMRSYPNARHMIDDFMMKDIQSPQIQKRIAAIAPMLEYSSSLFSAIRAKYKSNTEWQKTLEGTQLGEWIKSMLKTKGSASFDYSTRQVLVQFKEMAKKDGLTFNTALPAFYKGFEIEKHLGEHYFLATSEFLSKAAPQLDSLSKVRSYIEWRERDGAIPPPQNFDATP